MNINWKIRFKNPVFLAQFILSIITPIIGYMGLDLTAMTSWGVVGNVLLCAVSNPYVLMLVVVSLWNCINDPTTKGVCDSVRAQSYREVH